MFVSESVRPHQKSNTVYEFGYMYDGVSNVLPDVFSANCHLTLTSRINLPNTLLERETPRHQYSKATIQKTNANQSSILTCEHTPLKNKISVLPCACVQNCNVIMDIGFACKVQLKCKRSTINHVKDSKNATFQFANTIHFGLFIGDASLPKIYSLCD